MNSIEALVPVYPNCHAMLNTVDDGFTVEALKVMLRPHELSFVWGRQLFARLIGPALSDYGG